MNSKRIAIYPGTFDPVTLGHIDVLERASILFDKVIISVSGNSEKNTLFSTKERVDMIKEVTHDMKNVEADRFTGLVVDYAIKKKADALIRGLRAVSDFEFEFQMALTNRKISSKIETVFLMPNEKYSFISSTLVKEIARYGGELDMFVPKSIAIKLRKKFA